MRIAKYYGVYPSVVLENDVKWIYYTAEMIEADYIKEKEQSIKEEMKRRANGR